MIIHYLRHAESKFNAVQKANKGVNLDHMTHLVNAPLSDYGQGQASQIKGQYDLVLLSPMRRCRQTLQHSQIEWVRLQELSVLREFMTDVCDFMEGEERKIETHEQLADRILAIKEFLLYVRDLQKYKTVLIVSHGDLYYQMFGQWLESAQIGTIDLESFLSPVELLTTNGDSNDNSATATATANWGREAHSLLPRLVHLAR